MSAGSALFDAVTRFLGRRPRARRATTDDAQLALDLGASPPLSPATAPSVAPLPQRAPGFSPPAPHSPPAAHTAGRASQAHAAEALLRRLRVLGLRDGAAGGIDRLRLTRNRSVMVSFRRGELRVHHGYADAPDAVLAAVVAFVHARTRRQRAAAQRAILAHPVVGGDGADVAAKRRARERTLPADEPMARLLAEWHQRYNAQHFGGSLGSIPIRVSRRLKTRLGHYTARTPDGQPAEIVVGRAHIRRHGWEEALHTLLHEMVHQWQDESGHAIDHGRQFRRKAREVGITAAARRAVGHRPATVASPETAGAPLSRRLAG